jgi:hypothetical protein
MREDTRPETPMAKSNSDPPPAPGEWRSPTDLVIPRASDVPFDAVGGTGARFDWAAGSGRIRTFQLKGPAAWALALLVMAVVATFFVLVIGVGTAVAIGAGAVAVLGIGARAVRRRLRGAPHRQLGSRD